jgi:uncharacterized tellurite resistance protein B-like protein
MSLGDSFHERGMALENQFYAKVDQQLLEKLQLEQSRLCQVADLQKTLGIELSDELAATLVSLGISCQASHALRIVPLVLVAWGDGTISPDEKYRLMEAAKQHGVLESEASSALLNAWLETPPNAELLKTWTSYANAIANKLPPDQLAEFRSGLIGEMNRIATASGGLLGWGSVSPGEHKVIQTIEKALTKN